MRQLLDVTRARRVARESSLRTRAPATASPAASESHAAQPLPPTEPDRRHAHPEAPGWQRRPLADPRPNANPTPRPTESTRAPAAVSPPAVPAQAIPAAERRLAAELREARATLAIARETALTQREEIARLRAERAASLAPAALAALEVTASPPNVSFADAHAERLRLRERITALEAELERALLERAQLHQAMAAQQQEAIERNRSQAALQERLEQLERELDETRRRAEDEHHRHAEAQALLANLRSALRCADPAAAPSPEMPADGSSVRTPVPPPAALPRPQPPLATMQALASDPASDPEAAPSAIAAPTASHTAPSSAPVLPHANPGSARAPIFSFWLEGQIRRSFGPLGIDSIPDLVREPLARRARSAGGPLAILLAGPGVAAESRAFAESLLRSGAPEFVLYVADPDGAIPRLDGGEDPLRGCIRDRGLADRPQALQACLHELEPAVVVTRELLTWQTDVAPWLDVLRSASEGGAALVLLEQTGLGRVTPDDAFTAIGERIWELLPERYARDPETGRRLGRFRDAFAARPTPPRNALLQRLREGFELELFARFGFLAEAFVRGPIAGHFDPKQARDRRFIDQIADVDERRLESGSGSALYLVARIDPAEAR